MGSVNIYDQGNDRTYSVSFNLKSTYLNEDNGIATGEIDFYIDVSTTIRKIDGTAFGHFMIKNLNDVPPGIVGAANDFSDICKQYVTYFINESELIASSSSSSNSSSSSSSSEGITSSSSSESSGSSPSSESSPSSSS